MLRIFRGERHADAAAQPAQHADAPTETDLRRPATPAEPQASDNGRAEPGKAEPGKAEPAPSPEPGFLERGRMRRRARFLRAARELAYRDLGGLVFDLHRFGARNDEVVQAKLDTLARIDSELRLLEEALRERRAVTVLREAGVAACPRCAAIHGSGDRFCPTCGLAVDQAERPIAGPNPPASPRQAAAAPSAGIEAPSGEATAPPAVSPPLPQPALPQSSAPPQPATAIAASVSPPQGPPPAGVHAALPAAPVRGEEAAPDEPTEVIRRGAPPEARAQRTAPFDPLSPPAGVPAERERVQEQRRP